MIEQFSQQDLELVAEDLAYDGFFKLKNIKIRQRLFQGGWSETYERELCIRGDAVGVLLYDPDESRFALVEQLRVGVIGRRQSPWLLELVAGMLDKDGEDKQDLARRETYEESGLEIKALEPVIEYFCSPGGSTEFFTLFCGQVDLADVKGGIFGVDHEHENIRLHILPVEDVIAFLNNGQINNAMTIIALQWFLLNRDRLDTLWRES